MVQKLNGWFFLHAFKQRLEFSQLVGNSVMWKLKNNLNSHEWKNIWRRLLLMMPLEVPFSVLAYDSWHLNAQHNREYVVQLSEYFQYSHKTYHNSDNVRFLRAFFYFSSNCDRLINNQGLQLCKWHTIVVVVFY